MNNLRVGVIGAGFMGHTYVKTVQTMVNGAEMAAVAGGTRAPELARQYGLRLYDRWEELVADDSIQLVCIATPHAQHAAPAIAAARAGKHLMIDKPMACSVAECDAVIEACEKSGARCSITYTQRDRIGYVKAKELIDSGAFGGILEIRSYHVVPNGVAGLPPWQMKPENIGVLFGHGIHNFDAVRGFTGREIKRVFAKCRTLTGAPVEATSDVLLTMDDGGVHYIFCSFEVPKPGFPRTESGARITCERGLIDMDTYGETCCAPAGGEWRTLAVQPRIDWAGKGFLDPVRLETYAALLQDLVDSVKERRQPKITAWDGRQAVAAALAAYESGRTGREVSL